MESPSALVRLRPALTYLPDDVQLQLVLRLDARNTDRKGALMVGDQPAGVDALRGTQHLGIGLRSFDHGLWIGQRQQRG